MLKKGTATSKDGINTTNLYTYQYNEQGYPVKEYVNYSLNGTTGTLAFTNEYKCQ
jgi:hypothetical protein